MKGAHWIQVSLGGVAVLANYVAASVPAWAPAAHVVTAVATAALTGLGLVTGKVGVS